jgi:hypothetical protein
MRFRPHVAALAFLCVAAGCESQANENYREQRAIQRNPPTLTTTASVLTAPQSSPPAWLSIVPPEEPRPLGASRAMTEAPLSQWLVKGTYPTQTDCDNVLHPKPSPASSTGKVVTAPLPTYPQVIGPFSNYWPPQHSLSSGAQCMATDDPRRKP